MRIFHAHSGCGELFLHNSFLLVLQFALEPSLRSHFMQTHVTGLLNLITDGCLGGRQTCRYERFGSSSSRAKPYPEIQAEL
jgi:hypothetical protein